MQWRCQRCIRTSLSNGICLFWIIIIDLVKFHVKSIQSFYTRLVFSFSFYQIKQQWSEHVLLHILQRQCRRTSDNYTGFIEFSLALLSPLIFWSHRRRVFIYFITNDVPVIFHRSCCQVRVEVSWREEIILSVIFSRWGSIDWILFPCIFRKIFFGKKTKQNKT